MKYVVDTNVPVCANHVSDETHLPLAAACSRFLVEITRKGELLDDDDDLIFTEYKRHLSFKGQPGIGDFFFRWYLQNRWANGLVIRVKLPSYSSISDTIPPQLRSFDSDDHKWIAVYLAGDADFIVNASDSDWANAKADLDGCGVDVLEISSLR